MKTTRREFGALLTAASWMRLQAQTPPSDRVRVGLIGFGVRGSQLLGALQRVPGAEAVAVADLYDGFLEHAKEMTNGAAETTKEYRRLLDRKDIDAVIVATPDHWHARIMTDAARAGKDVYAEKPIVHSWEEGAPLMRVFEETRRVVQVGSARVGLPIYQQAREIVQSGRLGKITFISTYWDSASSIYAWQYPVPPDASPQTIDWKTFLGSAPPREFDPHRFFRWRCYWDYGGGLPPDLWSHHLTAIHWITGAKMPSSVVAHGGIYRWKDGRDVPDTMSAFYEYPEGFAVSCSSTKTNSSRDQEFQFMGTEGTLVISRNELVIYNESGEEAYTYALQAWPKRSRDRFYVTHGMDQNGQPRVAQRLRPAVERLQAPARTGVGGSEHMANFISCVRSRQTPWETADMGYRAAIATCMANLAYQNRKMVTWDAARERPVW